MSISNLSSWNKYTISNKDIISKLNTIYAKYLMVNRLKSAIYTHISVFDFYS